MARRNKLSNLIKEPKLSEVNKLRAIWFGRGYDLIDITHLCEARIDCCGWCNGFNEPDENCYHIKINYRSENIASFDGEKFYVIDGDLYLLFVDDESFIIFRKVKLIDNQKEVKK